MLNAIHNLLALWGLLCIVWFLMDHVPEHWGRSKLTEKEKAACDALLREIEKREGTPPEEPK